MPAGDVTVFAAVLGHWGEADPVSEVGASDSVWLKQVGSGFGHLVYCVASGVCVTEP